MGMKKTVYTKIVEARLLYPLYQGKGDADIAALVNLFVRILQDAKATPGQVEAAFDHHFANNSDRFPTPADIVKLTKPVVAYRMNYGPKGWGGLYHESHPYVQHQSRLGQPIDQYKVHVRPLKAKELSVEASNAPRLTWYGDDGYEEE